MTNHIFGGLSALNPEDIWTDKSFKANLKDLNS